MAKEIKFSVRFNADKENLNVDKILSILANWDSGTYGGETITVTHSPERLYVSPSVEESGMGIFINLDPTYEIIIGTIEDPTYGSDWCPFVYLTPNLPFAFVPLYRPDNLAAMCATPGATAKLEYVVLGR